MQHRLGQLLGPIDIGLVEGVDVEQCPGERHRDLPTDDLKTQISRIGEVDEHGGMSAVGAIEQLTLERSAPVFPTLHQDGT